MQTKYPNKAVQSANVHNKDFSIYDWDELTTKGEPFPEVPEQSANAKWYATRKKSLATINVVVFDDKAKVADDKDFVNNPLRRKGGGQTDKVNAIWAKMIGG